LRGGGCGVEDAAREGGYEDGLKRGRRDGDHRDRFDPTRDGNGVLKTSRPSTKSAITCNTKTISVDTSVAAMYVVAESGVARRRFRMPSSRRTTSWIARPANAVFAPELSLAREVSLRLQPETDVWRSKITTVARSERGFEETVQGFSLTPRWPAHRGEAELELGP